MAEGAIVGLLLDGVEAAWPYAVVAAPGLFALYDRWRERRKDKTAAHNDLVKIAQDAAASVIEDLREETDRLRSRLEEVENELRDLHHTHNRMIADKDAKIMLLEGEKRQLEAKISAYEVLLERNGIPKPRLSEAYWVSDDAGRLTPAASAEATEATLAETP